VATQNAINTPLITLGGTFTMSGAFPFIGMLTGSTNVTFPTSGTLATTSQIPTLPVPLASGGTSASLVANNGGIFYSTASAGAILAGTATANQILMSGSSSAPAWSSAVYPATTTINQLLYSSSANAITGLATANNGVLITSAGGVPSISLTLPSAVQGNITQLGTVSVVGGPLNMSGFQINDLASPVVGTDAVNKNYADSIAGGITVQLAVLVATTGTNLTATYNNGSSGIGATLTNAGTQVALTIDGVLLSTTNRVLVKDQTATADNGIFSVTNTGSGSTNWVLTRTTDYDLAPSQIKPGNLVPVNSGTLNAGTSWIQSATVNTIGTDPILFTSFTYSPSNFLQVKNNLSDVANKITSFNNISPLTTKGDLISFDGSNNVRVAVGGSNGQILQVNSVAASGLSWSTATYPTTTTINQILFSSANNVVSQIPTQAGSGLLTNGSGVPAWVSATGSGAPVLANTPTLITPILGIATATSLQFSPTTSGIIGTPTNDNAAAGVVGEFITTNNFASPISISSNIPTNVVSISLTAGDWDVFGSILLNVGGPANKLAGWISTTSATEPAFALNEALFTFQLGTIGSSAFCVPQVRLSLAGTTTVFLSGIINFSSGSSTAGAGISARRVR
jgi:hypothetical protein